MKFLAVFALVFAVSQAATLAHEEGIVPRGFFDGLFQMMQQQVAAAKEAVQHEVAAAKELIQQQMAAAHNVVHTLDAEGRKVLNDVTNLVKMLKGIDLCSWNDTTLSCCASVQSQSACVKVGFQESAKGIALTYELDLNGRIMFEGIIDSSTLPATQCVPIPQAPAVSICVTPFNMKVADKELSVCLEASVQALSQVPVAVNLNCFQLLDKTVSVLPPGKGPITGLVNLDTSSLPTPKPFVLPF